MIVDVHGHYTQAPPQLDAFRGWQVSMQNQPARRKIKISDDMIADTLQGNLRQMRERGIDRVMFSPRASGMGHDFGGPLISRYWTEVSNDLIGRACTMFPEQFSPVCQLPQSPGVSPRDCLEELERCVTTMGFVGCNINPDVAAGREPFTPPLSDEWWYPPVGEDGGAGRAGHDPRQRLRQPGDAHERLLLPSPGTSRRWWSCGNSRVFKDFPDLHLVIPHGGGSIPFQYARHRALHALANLPPFEELIRPLYFDLAVYDADAMEMVIRKIGADRVLYRQRDVRHGGSAGPADRPQLRRHRPDAALARRGQRRRPGQDLLGERTPHLPRAPSGPPPRRQPPP